MSIFANLYIMVRILLLLNSSELNAQGTSNIPNSLSKMRRNFFCVMEANVSQCLINTVDRNVVQFNAQDISNILLPLDQMGMKWVDIRPGSQDNLLDSVKHNVVQFNAQNISNNLLALDEMGVEIFDLKDTAKGLIDSVTRLCQTLCFRDIRDCVNAFDHLGFYWQDFRIPGVNQKFLVASKDVLAA